MAEPGIIPIFKTITVPNLGKSQKAGRPIFDEMEVCEIRFAGNRDNAPVFPAHDVSVQAAQADGTTIPLTYAERFADQYAAFKKGKEQVLHGTPLAEVPFLTEAKRAELRALNIHTVENLASLDGMPLKKLGMDGREIVGQAQAYLQNAASSSNDVRLAAENEALRAELEELRKASGGAQKAANPYDGMSDDDLKDYIKDRTGAAPKGNPNRDTLERMASEAKAAKV